MKGSTDIKIHMKGKKKACRVGIHSKREKKKRNLGKTSSPLLLFFQVYQVLNPTRGSLYYSRFFFYVIQKRCRETTVFPSLEILDVVIKHKWKPHFIFKAHFLKKSIFKIINFPWILASSFQVSVWPNLFNKSNGQVISCK